MRAAHLRGTEFVGMAGGALLILGLFLPWYATDASNTHSEIGGKTGSLSGWDVHPVLRWLLLAAASAPFVLAWIILRDHTLSWARGEMTVVRRSPLRPGRLQRLRRPAGRHRQISLRIGFFAALVGRS